MKKKRRITAVALMATMAWAGVAGANEFEDRDPNDRDGYEEFVRETQEERARERERQREERARERRERERERQRERDRRE